MKTGQKISIIPSVDLSAMGLNDLIGRQAVVSEISEREDGTIRGCWAILEGEPYNGEKEWYLPNNSYTE